MPVYQESCPNGFTSKVIIFSIKGNRIPHKTKGCICTAEMVKYYEQKYGIPLSSIARAFMAAAWHNSLIRKISE